MNTIVANKQQPNISFKSPINKDEFKLKIKLTKEVAIQWHETYLSKDQTLKVVDNGDLLLEATIIDSYELRNWLYSFGRNQLKILEPQIFQDEQAQTAS